MTDQNRLILIASQLFSERTELRTRAALDELSQELKKQHVRYRVRMSTLEDVLIGIGFCRSTETDHGRVVVKWRRGQPPSQKNEPDERRVDRIEQTILEMTPDEYCLMDLERLSQVLVKKSEVVKLGH